MAIVDTHKTKRSVRYYCSYIVSQITVDCLSSDCRDRIQWISSSRSGRDNPALNPSQGKLCEHRRHGVAELFNFLILLE